MIKKKDINYNMKIGLSIVLLLFISGLIFSQTDSFVTKIDLAYKDYMTMVLNNNLEYAAEKYNLNISKAQIEAAKIYQNPSITIERSGDPNDYSLSTEISKTFELARKRKARINVAITEDELNNALFNDYLRNIQADATLDYLLAVQQNYLYDVMKNSYHNMRKLSQSDSIRLYVGSIKSIDAIQSKIESEVLFNMLLQIEADRKNAFLNLSVRTSKFHNDTIIFPTAKFNNVNRDFLLNDLLVLLLEFKVL